MRGARAPARSRQSAVDLRAASKVNCFFSAGYDCGGGAHQHGNRLAALIVPPVEVEPSGGRCRGSGGSRHTRRPGSVAPRQLAARLVEPHERVAQLKFLDRIAHHLDLPGERTGAHRLEPEPCRPPSRLSVISSSEDVRSSSVIRNRSRSSRRACASSTAIRSDTAALSGALAVDGRSRRAIDQRAIRLTGREREQPALRRRVALRGQPGPPPRVFQRGGVERAARVLCRWRARVGAGLRKSHRLRTRRAPDRAAWFGPRR